MATVFRARDRELRRDVAVKVLFPHLCKNREVFSRFHREARAAAALDHRHILRVFDVGGGADGGRGEADPPYMVLELVRGPSLDAVVAEHGALLAEVVAAIGAALCAALAEAHRAGVIHRDVKPANVLVAEGGRVVLGDFGVARVADDDSSVVTRTGALLGTPAFMSPEQATGGELDARSDLYSLGAALYQLATGSLPVTGSAARAVAQIAAGEVVPPLRRAPRIGVDLARVIERLMRVDPGDRFADAAEAEAALQGVVAAGLGPAADDLARPDERRRAPRDSADGSPEPRARAPRESGAGRPIAPAEALARDFFADPVACQARLIPIVLASTLSAARAAAGDGKSVRALALADRALALDPTSREALALVDSIGRGRARRRTALLGVALTAAIALTWAALSDHLPFLGEADRGKDDAANTAPPLASASAVPATSRGGEALDPGAGPAGLRAAAPAPANRPGDVADTAAGPVGAGPADQGRAGTPAGDRAGQLGSAEAAPGGADDPRAAATGGADDPRAATTGGADDPRTAATGGADDSRAAATGSADDPRAAATGSADDTAAASHAAASPTGIGPAGTAAAQSGTADSAATDDRGERSSRTSPASRSRSGAGDRAAAASPDRSTAGRGAPRTATTDRAAGTPATAPSSRGGTGATAGPPSSATAGKGAPSSRGSPGATAGPASSAGTAAVADAVVAIEMDAWCRVTVDGRPSGEARPRLELRVAPGPHTISCAQDIPGRHWSQRIDADPGERIALRGRVLPPPVPVTVSLRHGDAVRINRKRVVKAGATLRLPVARYRIEILRDGEPVALGFLDLRGPACTLVDEPAIACR